MTHRPGVGTAALLERLPAPAARARERARGLALARGVSEVVVDPAQADDVRAALLDLPEVEAVEPNRILRYATTGRTQPPDDPRYGEQWSHRAADAPGAWLHATGSKSIRIAIVDSGIDRGHPDLAGVVDEQVHIIGSRGTATLRSGPGPLCTQSLPRNHGTWVAGVAAAAGDNGVGITGVLWRSSVIDIQISSPDPQAANPDDGCLPTDAKAIRGLQHVADHPQRIDVVNLSLGGREASGVCPPSYQRVIDAVRARGTAVVAAAGNDGDYSFQVPAGCRGVIAVAALDRNGNRPHFSSLGAYLDVAAPGADILTTARGGGYGAISGTSFAAPYVAGAIGLLQQLRIDRGLPRLTPDQAEGTLEATAAHPLGRGQHDERLGWGRLSLSGAVTAVRDGNTPLPRAARMSPGSGRTEPIAQAIAVSRRTFDAREAERAVIGRADDYADALAGSSLAYGLGPLLFAPRTGGLPAAVRAELQRVLPASCPDAPGGRCVVYLLGGTAALDARLEDEVRALGYTPRRLSGSTREATAVAVAEELRTVLGRTEHREFILATGRNWPDAVAAGSLGAVFGIPILLTHPGELHSATAAYLRSANVRPSGGYAIGGGAALSDRTAQQAAAAAGLPALTRLAGAARDGTAVAVSEALERRLRDAGYLPSHVVAVHLDRPDGYAHALSASVVAGRTFSVFVPVRGPDAQLTGEAVRYACHLPGEALLAGDVDLLPDALGRQLRAVLRGESEACPPR